MDNVALFLIKDVNFNKQHSVIPRDCSSLTKVSTRIYKQYVKGLYFTIIVLLNKYKQLIAQLHCSMPCMADEIIFDIHNGWNDAHLFQLLSVTNFVYNDKRPLFQARMPLRYQQTCKNRKNQQFLRGLQAVLNFLKSRDLIHLIFLIPLENDSPWN